MPAPSPMVAPGAPGENRFPKLALYERFIAIDDACGWPPITPMPDGTLNCLIWPHPVHGYTEGAAELWVSTDGGRFWKKAGVPVPYLPAQNRMNVAGGLAADGSYVALISGWDKRMPVGWRPDPLNFKSGPHWTHLSKANTLNPVPAVSHDGGRTWKQFPAVDARQPSGQGIVPFGRIAPLADGTIGVMMYRDEAAFFVSSDGGATWQKRGQLVGDPTFNETAWLRLDNGDPEARAWSAPIRLIDLEGATDEPNLPKPRRDGGYPSTVVLAGGTLVTAYYSRGMPAHQRYHVGVVRWALPVEEKKPQLP